MSMVMVTRICGIVLIYSPCLSNFLRLPKLPSKTKEAGPLWVNTSTGLAESNIVKHTPLPNCIGGTKSPIPLWNYIGTKSQAQIPPLGKSYLLLRNFVSTKSVFSPSIGRSMFSEAKKI